MTNSTGSSLFIFLFSITRIFKKHYLFKLFVRNGIDDEISPVESEPGVELNRRGIPARKRKKNSLIFGDDDLVSLPVRSPKKKAAAAKPVSQPQLPLTSSRGERKQLPLSSRKGERQLQLPKSIEKEIKKKVRTGNY